MKNGTEKSQSAYFRYRTIPQLRRTVAAPSSDIGDSLLNQPTSEAQKFIRQSLCVEKYSLIASLRRNRKDMLNPICRMSAEHKSGERCHRAERVALLLWPPPVDQTHGLLVWPPQDPKEIVHQLATLNDPQKNVHDAKPSTHQNVPWCHGVPEKQGIA